MVWVFVLEVVWMDGWMDGMKLEYIFDHHVNLIAFGVAQREGPVDVFSGSGKQGVSVFDL